jgi:Ser/Thr protein kinase RdoA (MazF antagonist)
MVVDRLDSDFALDELIWLCSKTARKIRRCREPPQSFYFSLQTTFITIQLSIHDSYSLQERRVWPSSVVSCPTSHAPTDDSDCQIALEVAVAVVSILSCWRIISGGAAAMLSIDGAADEKLDALESVIQEHDGSDDADPGMGDYLISSHSVQACNDKSSTTMELSDEEMRKLLQPDPTEEQVLQILHSYYCKGGEDATIDERLDSYDDCNFKVKVGGELYLLKIHNGVESKTLVKCLKESNNSFYQQGGMKSVIHLQNAMMELCQEHNIPSNHPVRPVAFKERKPQEPGNGSKDPYEKHPASPVVVAELPVLSAAHSPCALAVRLLTWAPGRPLSSVPNAGIEVIADAGRMLAKLDRVLDHLNANSLEGRLDRFGSNLSLLARGSAANLRRASIAPTDQARASARKRGSIVMSSLPIEEFRAEMLAMSTAQVPGSGTGAVLETTLLIPARRYHQWDGKNTADLRRFADYVVDSRRKSLVLSILDAFEDEILGHNAAQKLRVGVIHGDFNDANILVDDKMNISGVIDFGDSVERSVL